VTTRGHNDRRTPRYGELSNEGEFALMDNGELGRRLTALQDIEAIKRLKAEYCDICDDAHNPDRMVVIFAEDGIWEGQGLWRAQGHEDIRKQAKSFAQRISFSQHNVFNPRIEVNGNAARARWNFLGPFTFRKETRQIWLGALYEDDCVKVDGVWKFQRLGALVRMIAPYEEGWTSKVKVDVFSN
jgi:hypothetical protein